MNARSSMPYFAVALCVMNAAALAQTNVSPAAKSSWGENAGWMNWRDAGTPAGALGAHANLIAGFMSGRVWHENLGWVNLGNGAGPYDNTTGLDYGVNIDTCDGFTLSGMAWSENAGWVNFRGGALATPPNPARFDAAEARMRGHAWGENIGWINLDTPTDANGRYVGFTVSGPVCDCIDFNHDGLLPDVQDIADFIEVFAGGTCPTGTCNDVDFNNDGLFPDVLDIDSLLSVFAGGPCI